MSSIIIKSLLIGAFACSSLVAQAADWELAKDDTKNGIQVFTRVVEGSPLKEFRGIAKVPTTISGAVALVNDHAAGSQWIHDCKEIKTLERPSATDAVFYMVTAAPWPVKDRDSVIQSHLTQNSDSLVARIDMAIKNDVMDKVKGRVRITEMHGSWVFTPVDANTTEIIYQAHADPAGSLPNWLVNSLVVDMPYNTLKNMQTKVLEEQYLNAEVKSVVNFK